ncbi:MAG: hypothetical protein C5B51_01460 [Terriglobia bacterium]|nr:MAG: hypothetical protein C5B51_01460 [Terriglobia bacterium]
MGGRVAAAPEGAPEQGVPEESLMLWEPLRSSGGLLSVLRAKVPGGWLVYVCNGFHRHAGLTFYPDPEHRWDGVTLP